MNTQLALALPSSASSNTVVINARCTLRVREDQRVIVVAGLPVHHYRADDVVATASALPHALLRPPSPCISPVSSIIANTPSRALQMCARH
jgi:hypothetical protein